jgi:hypothetical protein
MKNAGLQSAAKHSSMYKLQFQILYVTNFDKKLFSLQVNFGLGVSLVPHLKHPVKLQSAKFKIQNS